MESSLAFMDDLLDFASDIGGEEEEEDVLPFQAKEASHLSELNDFHPDDSCRVSPDYAEEELEWLSNKDAFPAVETFVGILSEQPSKQLSPVSVLDNSSSSSNSSGGNKTNSIHGSTLMSCCGGLKVPGKARSKRRRKHSSGHQWFKHISDQQPISKNVKNLLMLPPEPAKSSTIGRKCLHCGAEKTPQWRAGPNGPKTLCNACGVRYKSGRLVPEYRPASSPTFSPEMHSNSHRKVMEMRRQKQIGWLVNPMEKG